MKNVEFFVSFFLLMIFTEVMGQQCNLCNKDTRFACFSVSQYIPCDANGFLNLEAIANCPAGFNCVNSGSTILASPCIITGTPTCSTALVPLVTTTTTTTTTTSTTTTSNPAFNATSFCATKATGRFTYPSSLLCTTYVNCYIFGGGMLGAIFKCPGTTLFNPTTLICDPNYRC